MKYCMHCGSEMSDEAEFCKNCGKGVKTIKEVSGKSVAKKPLIIGCSIGIVLVSIIMVSLFATGAIFGKKDDTTRIQEIINEPREQEKKDDRTRLQEIITEQKALGADVKGINIGSGDGSSNEHQYVWDEEGNLIGVHWYDMSLSGDIVFSEFTHLELLGVYGNNKKMTGLDVSGCSALTHLRCSGENQLINLDVSGCTLLTELNCHRDVGEGEVISRGLRELNLNDCKSLKKLYCGANLLESLDVSKCINLEELYCANNQLKNLDVSACVNLERLDCSNTQLNSLDVSACTKLENLSTDSSCIVKGYEEH